MSRPGRSPLDYYVHLLLPNGDQAYPVQVSVDGIRTDDGTACTLLAIRETTGTWVIHSLDQGAVRLTKEQAARMATGILHLLGASVDHTTRSVSE